ncbi:Kelch repeat-containing F-box family protein [Melia azedarach]|uniref:Kelch repeat-containing F-box family protein n=1 Tax=Melia azedarach TaxID=155640 RepID=A0ACC1YMU8_MELAZ|nr:Kelch repeat-containing F-box family protein [Melia azedarach]
MSEGSNSRHFAWLMKSCFPNQNDSKSSLKPSPRNPDRQSVTISDLPDDLLLECLTRVPSYSLSTLCFVCRRWSRLLHSPSFFNLRRYYNRLDNIVFAFSSSTPGLIASTLSFADLKCSVFAWKTNINIRTDYVFFGNLSEFLPQSRLAVVGPRIYVVGRNATLRYDYWTDSIISLAPMLVQRKRFACAVVFEKIYIAGGSSSSATTVDEYDPDSNRWRVVSNAPRIRYGCIGASADGVFYIIGGLKIDSPVPGERMEAHIYMSSMDLYDVKTRAWLRSRAVPGGGCIIAACASVGYIYILLSHAVELSFWRFDARRNHSGFGEWSRMKTPEIGHQLRLDGSIKFSLVGARDKVMLVLMKNQRLMRNPEERFIWIYETTTGDWSCGPDLPMYIPRASCVSMEF